MRKMFDLSGSFLPVWYVTDLQFLELIDDGFVF
jgi:hypothetical protein